MKFDRILQFNYLKIAGRLIHRQKFYPAVSIGGLSVGIAATFLIMFYVLGELSYDKFHNNANSIYMVNAITL